MPGWWPKGTILSAVSQDDCPNLKSVAKPGHDSLKKTRLTITNLAGRGKEGKVGKVGREFEAVLPHS